MISPSDVDAFLFILFFIDISSLQLECTLFLSLSVSLSLSITSVLHSSVLLFTLFTIVWVEVPLLLSEKEFLFQNILLLFSLMSKMVLTRCSIFCISKFLYKHLSEMCVHLTWFAPLITHPLYALVEHMSSYSPGNCSVHSSP